ncbi:MAG: hypothetical protein NXI25_26730 [bacterium]|nr:hypothetical protein [bacterium]
MRSRREVRQVAGFYAGQVRRNFRQWSTGQLEKNPVVLWGDNWKKILGRILTLAQARQAGGFDAGQVARPGGFYARQARQGGAVPSRRMTV